MRIVSWNCKNGLNEEKAETIRKEYPDADIFVIQECRRADIYNFKDNWKFKNWYGDDQEIKSDLGIAVFSKNHKIEFSDVFNRNFRYVVPYKVVIDERNSFMLFAVWTKPVSLYYGKNLYYDENVTRSVCADEYQALIKGNAIIIGDFNTGYTENHLERYTKLCEGLKGFTNCESGKPEEFKKTFFSYSKNKLYLNDFCFVSENLYSSVNKFETNENWKENDYGQKSWNDSDHCPIIVDFAL